MNITRNVIADLWALVAAGEASADSQRLVDEYLAAHPDFASELRADRQSLDANAPDLPPDHEARTLDRTKRQLRRRSPFRILAVVCSALAIARMIQDTTFTSSPVRFIATSIVAIICWGLYGWHTQRLREAKLPAAEPFD